MFRSTRLHWPFPRQNANPWYPQFLDFAQAQDATAFAAMEDRNLFITGGGTFSFDATTGTLSWSAALEVNSPFTGFRQILAPGSAVIANGMMGVVELHRGVQADATLSFSSVLSLQAGSPAEVSLGICYRRGSLLYFRNGAVLQDGASRAIFSEGGSGGSSIGISGQKLRALVPIALRQAESTGITTAVGNYLVDPADYVVSGTTLTATFVAVGFVSGGGVEGAVVLRDLTANTSIATLTFAGDTTPTARSFGITLPDAAHMFEVRITRTQGSGTLHVAWSGLHIDRIF